MGPQFGAQVTEIARPKVMEDPPIHYEDKPKAEDASDIDDKTADDGKGARPSLATILSIGVGVIKPHRSNMSGLTSSSTSF